jgi:serine phosphatase RsbU (regulator of sigma subunit)/PAS domain-containing protein
VFGLALGVILPAVAGWLTSDVTVFDRFPGVPFLAATVVATLVGRLSASVVATIASGLVIGLFDIAPFGSTSGGRAGDLIAIGVLGALSLTVSYALASKDAARDDAADARSAIEELAVALASERNTMRQILQQMPNGVIVADANGALTIVNARARELLQMHDDADRPVADQAASWTARRPEGDLYLRGEYPLTRSLRTGEIVLGERMTIERRDGSTVLIEVDSAPIRSGDGEAIVGAVAAFQDISKRVETEAELARTTTRLRQIQAVTDATLTGLGFDELATRLLTALRAVLQTDSATLLLLDRAGTALVEHTTVGVTTDGPGVPVPVGRGIAGKIAATVSTLVVDDLSQHGPVRHWLTDVMSSLMGAPLVYRGKVTGVIHVASRTPRSFTADEVEVLELAANRIASALERAAINDSRSAMSQALQRSLVPASLPEIDGIDLAATYLPFAPDAEIGGDFYDVFPHGDGTWGIAIGDVSGKGPGAAAVMGLAAHTIRALARYETRPSAVLTALNDALLQAERVATERFCTACEMRLRPDRDGLRVTVCLAGHPMPLLVRSSGEVEPVGAPGTLLGTFPDPALRDVVVDMAPGDTIVAYTDGLVERRDLGIEAGEAMLADVLSSCAGRSSETILRRIQQVMVDRSTVDDDIAIVVVRKG